MPSSSISKELPSGRPACPANRPSTVGVPVDVVGRESSGEGRVPGIVESVIVVEDDDELGGWEGDERGRFRLRNDILVLCMLITGWLAEGLRGCIRNLR